MEDERAGAPVTVLVNGQRRGGAHRAGHRAAVRPAQSPRPEGDQVRLRARPVRGVPGAGGRAGRLLVRHCRCGRCGTRRSPRSRGWAPPDRPHPVTRALIAGQAAQCGYCLSGVIIAAAGLLERNADPSDEEVRTALDGNLCRCGAHNRIVRAVLAAAAELRAAAGRRTTGGQPAGDGMNPARDAAACRPRSGEPAARRLAAGAARDGVIEVRPGKVELGQGVLTALAQVAAEELDVGLGQVRMMPAVTGLSPDEGYTAGSLSIQHSGAALRLVCAEARGRYLAAASGPARRARGQADRRRRRDPGPGRPGHQLLGARRRRAARPACHRRLPAQAGLRVPPGRHQRAPA